MRRTCAACTLALAFAVGACGVRSVGSRDGRPVLRRHVDAPADTLWTRIHESTSRLGLVVTAVHPDQRIIELDWVTAPGDGRLYLRCRERGAIGSASLKHRIRVVEEGEGSALVIDTRIRTTIPAACESTGHFESWLLGRLGPAITAAVEAASDPTRTFAPDPAGAADASSSAPGPALPDSTTSARGRPGTGGGS